MIQNGMMENRRLALMRKLEDKRLGLPVSAALPDEVYQLMDLFPQAGAQRPSVQYIPVPYKKAAGKPEEK